jgi:NADH-quinone oxidoreductase subunit J
MGPLGTAYFYACALAAIAGALAVVIAKNPIRGAMGLLLLVLSIAGLFLVLHAQFLAAVQLIIYAGAIVVLFLFVIMLLGPSASTPSDRRGLTVRLAAGGLFALAGLGALGAVARATAAAQRIMPMPNPDANLGGIDAFGAVLFSDALIPFELSAALLMVAVIGSVAVARGRQGLPSPSRPEQESAKGAAGATAQPPGEHSGVYSHEIDHAADEAGSA